MIQAMVKIPGDPEPYQERQKEKRRERRKKRNLSHIIESEMVGPAKEFLEGYLINPDEIVAWSEEPKVVIRSRQPDEPASKVWECVFTPIKRPLECLKRLKSDVTLVDV